MPAPTRIARRQVIGVASFRWGILRSHRLVLLPVNALGSARVASEHQIDFRIVAKGIPLALLDERVMLPRVPTTDTRDEGAFIDGSSYTNRGFGLHLTVPFKAT